MFLSRLNILMHADYIIVMANPSVRLSSICHTLVLYLSGCTIVKLFLPSGRGTTVVFGVLSPFQHFKGNPSAWALNTLGWEKLAIFDQTEIAVADTGARPGRPSTSRAAARQFYVQPFDLCSACLVVLQCQQPCMTRSTG